MSELPVKTLGKCRCVCKSWHSLIISPSFMAAHLKHYTRNDANSLILYKEIVKSSDTSRDFEEISLFRDLDMLKQGNRFHISTCPFIVPQCSMSSFHFVGSVNGLLCFSDCPPLGRRDRILIWNPLIQKSIKLSESTTGNNYVVGFGYDCRRNDHRVVKISYSDKNTPPLVEVYSVQERTWRTICAKYLVDNSINNIYDSHCFRNGVIHWLLRGRKAGINSSLGECLLLFNVAEEMFAKMELPEEIVKSAAYYFGIFEYQGMLSVSRCEYTDWDIAPSAQFNIWVKRDYNVESSWCKILNVGIRRQYFHMGPIEYLGANEVLIGICKENTGRLVTYDPKTRQMTELGLCASASTKFSAFSESLTLLDQNIDDLTADELERSDNRRRRTRRDFLEYLFGDKDNVDQYLKMLGEC